jgi:hypothetical protein
MEVMTFVVLAAGLVGVAVISAFVIRLSSDVTAIGTVLKDFRSSFLREYPVMKHRQHRLNHWSRHIHRMGDYGFFTIWEWRESENKWVLVSALVPPGFDPGQPPRHRGAFEGDHVKQWVRRTQS